MESATDVLEMTSPLLSDTNKDQFDKISELKKTFESQKKWINLLMRKRLPMQLIPPENIVDMKVKSFGGLMQSCKWVNALLTENRSNFVLHESEIVIDYSKTKDYTVLSKNCQDYRFRTITFRNFGNNVDELLAILNSLNGTVSVTQVYLFNTVAIKELFLYLRPTYLTVRVDSSPLHFHCPIAAVTRDKIPGHLSLATSRRKQQIFFDFTELLIANNNVTRMEIFHSKAKLSGLIYVPFDESPNFYLLHKAEPGFVVTKFSNKERLIIPKISVEMKYCSTSHELYKFAISLYSNDNFEHDSGDLRDLRNIIDDHLSSSNVNDACYDSFETIEKQEFKLRPTQLEASGLSSFWNEPILFLRTTANSRLETKNTLATIVLETASYRTSGGTTEIVTRSCRYPKTMMVTEAFVKALGMCKKIKKSIDCKLSTSTEHRVKYLIDRLWIEIKDDMDQWWENGLKCCNYFRFKEIKFFNFEKETDILRAVVSKFADRNICCDTLALFNTVLTQEIMEDLRPKYIFLTGNIAVALRTILNMWRVYSLKILPIIQMDICLVSIDNNRLIPIVEDLVGKHFDVNIMAPGEGKSFSQSHRLFMQVVRCCIEKMKSRRGNGLFVFDCQKTHFSIEDINQEEISQGDDCFSYIRSTEISVTFIFVTKATGGVVAGVLSNNFKIFLCQFIRTMEDFEKLFTDGTRKNDRTLGPEDEIAFSTIRSYFSQ